MILKSKNKNTEFKAFNPLTRYRCLFSFGLFWDNRIQRYAGRVKYDINSKMWRWPWVRSWDGEMGNTPYYGCSEMRLNVISSLSLFSSKFLSMLHPGWCLITQWPFAGLWLIYIFLYIMSSQQIYVRTVKKDKPKHGYWASEGSGFQPSSTT